MPIEILLRYLPFGVNLDTPKGICKLIGINKLPSGKYHVIAKSEEFNEQYGFSIEEVKPYLRPMSSITEDEKNELKAATCPEGTGYFNEIYLICPMNHFGEQISYEFMNSILNWLNTRLFDYNHYIEKNEALIASEGMYNF